MEEKKSLIDAFYRFKDAGMDAEGEYCLHKYKEIYGEDDGYRHLTSYVKYTKKVLVVGLDCEEEWGDFQESQTYRNMEYLSLQCGTDFFERLSEYLRHSDCRYVVFLEKGQQAKPEKIRHLLHVIESEPGVSAALCTSNIVNEAGEIVAHPDWFVKRIGDRVFPGKGLLQACLKEEKNLAGTLSTIMVRRESVNQVIPLREDYLPVMETAILYNLILNGNIVLSGEPMVDRLTRAYDKSIVKEKQKAYAQFISDGIRQGSFQVDITDLEKCGLPLCYMDDYGVQGKSGNRKRSITFYYTDKGEFFNLEPLAREAKKRGYEVIMTSDLNAESEIGVYCQHIAHPENAQFSVVLLHDMAQGHNRWPNLWELERWNIYDVGIVPGPSWKRRWEECAGQYYTNPRKGVFALGYPKGDYVNSDEIQSKAQRLKKEMGFRHDKTILYAPSWENDGKEDEFVCALASMEVNLLIKQAKWEGEWEKEIGKNIREMRALHEGKYENVYYVEPEESIMVALAMSDLIVSEESSVMTEGLLFGVPSVAVTDWLIPDTTPSRLASVPMDYVTKCKKIQLREYAEKVLNDERHKERILQYCNDTFTNIGKSCEEILDCVEYYTANGKSDSFQRHRLKPKNMPVCLWY